MTRSNLLLSSSHEGYMGTIVYFLFVSGFFVNNGESFYDLFLWRKFWNWNGIIVATLVAVLEMN